MKNFSVNNGALTAHYRYVIYIGRDLLAIDYIARGRQTVRSIGANIKLGASVQYSGSRKWIRGNAVCYNAPLDCAYETATEGLVVSDQLGKTCFFTTEAHYQTDFFNFLLKNYKLPLMEQWIPVLRRELLNRNLITERTNEDCWSCGVSEADSVEFPNIGELKNLIVVDCSEMSEDAFETVIRELLRTRLIKICNKPQKPLGIVKLDDYVERFSKEIVSQVSTQVRPVIAVDGTYHDSASVGLRLYPKQADAVNGIVSVLERSSYCIVNEGCGCGKTFQAIVATDGYYTRKWLHTHPGKTLKDSLEDPLAVQYRCIVLCPPHLVSKWCEEITQRVPYAKAIEVTSLSQMIQLRKHGAERCGKEFFVLNREIGKLNYSLAPVDMKVRKRDVKVCVCAKCGTMREDPEKTVCTCGCTEFVRKTPKNGGWKEEGLVCPECNQLLYPYKKLSARRWDQYADDVVKPLQPEDFASHGSLNHKCWHCGSSLWVPYVESETKKENSWYKTKRYKNAAHGSTDTIWLLPGYEEQYVSACGGNGVRSIDDFIPLERDVNYRRYSIVLFMKKYLKGFFDVDVIDEAHEYKGAGTAQGYAAQTVINLCDKTIALTGTLSGGSALDMFYLLFRLDSQMMIKAGFNYESSMSFAGRYGCIETHYLSEKDDDACEYNASSRGKMVGQPNVLPGISMDLLNLLLNHTIFLDLGDLSDVMPPLNEYVVGVDLEDDIRKPYSLALNEWKELYKEEKRAVLGKELNFALSYTDKPYDRLPIVSTISGLPVYDVQSVDKYKTQMTKKEEKLIEIINQEIKENRSIVVYAEYTGSEETCVTERLQEVIEKHIPELSGKVEVLRSGRPSARKRMDWLRKTASNGARVVITNPKMCETGLDFIFKGTDGKTYNFNTIIFFQMGYSLITLWQASSRHYRLIQTEECRTYYLFSRGTVQLDVIELMARKRNAVTMLQGGGFSSEGLAGMAKGDDAGRMLAAALQSGVEKDEEAVAELFQKKNLSGVSYDRDMWTMYTYEELTGKEYTWNEDGTADATEVQTATWDIMNLMMSYAEQEEQQEHPVVEDVPEIDIVKVVEHKENVSVSVNASTQKCGRKTIVQGQMSFNW